MKSTPKSTAEMKPSRSVERNESALRGTFTG